MSAVQNITAADTVSVQRACDCKGAAGCSSCAADEKLGVQPKLTLGPVNDHYEQEADRVADQVVSGGATVQPVRTTPLVQRMVEEPEEVQTKRDQIQRMAEEEDEVQTKRDQLERMSETEEEEEELQAKATWAPVKQSSATSLNAAASAVAGSGRGLSTSERGYFEPRFGRDLGHVRLHSDGTAARATQGINARAFTLRNNIAFAPGQLNAGTTEGRRLMAHEITHTFQQGAGDQRQLSRTPAAFREIRAPLSTGSRST